MNLLLAAVLAATSVTNPQLKDAEAVLAYLKAHPGDIALVSEGIRHNAGRSTPFASAAKIIHLAAYADAVRKGTVKPGEKVKVARWNAYHLPGTDGGAHEAALKRLKPGDTVTLDQVVSAMIEESDNAAPDLLRDRLGAKTLDRIAKTALTSLNGEILKRFGGCAQDAEACLKAYVAAGKPVTVTLPGYDEQADWSATVNKVKPSVLRGVLSRLAKDPVAKKHLEWPMRQPGADPDTLVIGTKGGALPGVITETMYTIQPGGKPKVTVFAMRGLPADTWASGVRSYAHQQFIVRMATDPAFMKRVRAAVK
ncbi:serine hydrolase [Nonomuraea sp. NPDC046570]|uniref:serine hydrolase n=1 Tax=Nonomuraea sp. NPDC046570 TaxID=3155255 RepID=UPI0033C5C1DB